jgi:hypothetical protein
MADDISMEFKKMLEVADDSKPHDLVTGWLNGDATPESLAIFFLKLREFQELNRLIDVFDRVVYFAFLVSSEAKETKQVWRLKLIAQIGRESELFSQNPDLYYKQHFA